MRRITLWVLATVAALILLFSYRTSSPPAPGSPSPASSASRPPSPRAAPGLPSQHAALGLARSAVFPASAAFPPSAAFPAGAAFPAE